MHSARDGSSGGVSTLRFVDVSREGGIMTGPRILIASVVLASCLLVASTAQAQKAPVSDVVVSVHPTVATMLVVSWNQDVAVAGGWLEFSINGGRTEASPERELAQGPQQELVLGAPADALVEVRIMNRLRPDSPGPLHRTETDRNHPPTCRYVRRRVPSPLPGPPPDLRSARSAFGAGPSP